MSLVLHKDAYTVDGLDLYRVSAKVDGKETSFSLQCKQIKTDGEIETKITEKLTLRGYTAGELSPITWE